MIRKSYLSFACFWGLDKLCDNRSLLEVLFTRDVLRISEEQQTNTEILACLVMFTILQVFHMLFFWTKDDAHTWSQLLGQ